MSRLIVCIPDVHVPYHHPRAWRAIVKLIRDLKPDHVVQLGDFMDMLAPARWSRGLAAEYAAGVEKEAEVGRRLLGDLRAVYEGPLDVLEGNHERRLRAYVTKYAPALAGVVRGVPELLDLGEIGATYRMRQPFKVANGVLAIHGEKLASALGAAGQSAHKERIRHGHSIVQGHSHRLGVGYDTTDRARFWMECGWVGDIRKAGYLSFPGVANWQLGFGVLTVDGSHVSPHPVPMRGDGSFLYERREYRG